MPILGYQYHDRLPDGFLRGVAEQTRGTGVPAGNRAIQRLAHDRVVGGIDDRREPGTRMPCLAARRDVRDQTHDADDLAVVVSMRRVARMYPAPAAVAIVDFGLVLGRLTRNRPLEVRTDHTPGLGAQHVFHLLPDDFVSRQTEPLRVQRVTGAIAAV